MSVSGLSDSMLARRDVRQLLIVSALCFGGATWALEFLLSHMVRGAPLEPFGGVYRLVESILWIGASAIAITVAERWPIEHVMRDWRKAVAQFALAIALGPVWGMLAYLISPFLMPWWHERGVWGVVAKEAKGALFGYIVTAVLVHVILRVRRQRAREVAVSTMERAAAEAQLVIRRLELQPAAMLRAMDAIARMIPNDADAANEALVALADTMRRSLALARVEFVSLRDEIAAVEDTLRLRQLTVGPRIEFNVHAENHALDALVPALLLPPIVDDLVGHDDSSQACLITLHAEPTEKHLLIRIASNVPAEPQAATLTASAADRLVAIFGDAAILRDEASTSSRRVCIEIPLRMLWPHESGLQSAHGSIAHTSPSSTY